MSRARLRKRRSGPLIDNTAQETTVISDVVPHGEVSYNALVITGAQSAPSLCLALYLYLYLCNTV